MGYSDEDDRSPQERANFEENLRRFHEPDKSPKKTDLDIGGGADASAVDTLFAGLDALSSGKDLPAPKRQITLCTDDDTATLIKHPVTMTPWDRARSKVDKAQERLDKTTPGTVNHAMAKWLVTHLLDQLKIETQRDGDPKWRTRRTVDGWRKGEGRDEYNASRRDKRRKVRDQPNADLSTLTEDERKQHRKEQKADSQWKSDKRKAGWTPDQIAAGLEQRKAKRKAKNEQDK